MVDDTKSCYQSMINGSDPTRLTAVEDHSQLPKGWGGFKVV